MTKKTRDKWSKKTYVENAKLLRKFGFSVSLNARRLSPQLKRQVKRKWNEKASYIIHAVKGYGKTRKVRTSTAETVPEYKERKDGSLYLDIRQSAQVFVFKKLTPSQRRKARGLFSKEQFTPTGVFIEKPANLKPSQFRVSIGKRSVEIRAGKRRDIIVPIDPKALARNPKKAIAALMGKRKPKGFAIMVNGFRGKNSHNIKSFFEYANNTLLDIYRKEGMTAEKFSDTFHLQLLY